LSKLNLFTEACAKLDKRGIVINEKRCLRKRHFHSSCQRCSSVCPNGAINGNEGLVFMAEKCTGCGACTSVCPSGALSVKLPSNKELKSLIALHVKHSGAVAFACETYFRTYPSERRRAIAVQCIARCDESILVDAVLQGATNVVIVNVSCAECSQYKICGLVQTMVDTANRLLECWQYPAVIALVPNIPEKIKPLPVTEEQVTGMSRRDFLTAFKRKSENFITQVLPEMILSTAENPPENINGLQNPMDEAKHLPEKWCSLIKSLKQLQSTAIPMKFQSSLWGDISIADNCNGCGACVEACPTSAIDILEQDGFKEIFFDASRCTQCSLCKDVCCCESIEIISTIALETIFTQNPRVLIEKKQEEIDTLLEPLEERMARLLGCVIKN